MINEEQRQSGYIVASCTAAGALAMYGLILLGKVNNKESLAAGISIGSMVGALTGINLANRNGLPLNIATFPLGVAVGHYTAKFLAGISESYLRGK